MEEKTNWERMKRMTAHS